MLLFNKEKIVSLCRVSVNLILLILVFWIPIYFSFFHETYNVFALDKAVFLRIMVSIAVLFYLARILLAGQLEYRGNRYLFALLVLLAGSWFFSASFSALPDFAFWGNYERQQGFFTLIFFLLFFTLLLLSLRNFFDVKKFVLVMLFSSFVSCFYGLVQFFGFDLIKWEETGRIFSTFGQPNFFGAFLILVIPFTVYAFVFLARRSSVRLVISILLIGQLACLLFTYSRSAWLGLAAEILFASLFFLFSRGSKKLGAGLIVFLLIGVITVSLFFSFSSRPSVAGYSPSSRLAAVFDLSQGSVKARLNIWQAAGEEFRQENLFQKLFGQGPDSFAESFARRYQKNWSLDERINTWPDRAHNSFLDIVLSFGLFGLGAYIIFFAYLLKKSWDFFKTAPRDGRFWLAAVCLFSLAGYFFNNLFNFSDTASYLYFYLILGLLVFLLFQDAGEKIITIKLAVISRLVIFLSFFFLAAIFIFYFNFRLLVADHYYMRAIVNISTDDCPTALDYCKKAIAWGGGNSLFYQDEYLAAGLYCHNRLSSEEKEALKGNLLLYVDTLPAEKYFFFAKDKANIEALLGNFQQADMDFFALAKKYPLISSVYEDWANYQLSRGDGGRAIQIVVRGLETLPLVEMESRGSFSHRPEIESQLVDFYDILARAYEQKEETDTAVEYYKKIIGLNPRYLLVYKKIADIYYRKKDFNQAIWYNNMGYKLRPTDYTWPLAIGVLYKQAGMREEAIASFVEAEKLAPAEKVAEIEKELNDLRK